MNDRELLRELAFKVKELAVSDEMKNKKQRWILHNKLESDEIFVLCQPEGAWCEILPDESLKCTDPRCRKIEFFLRQQLHLASIGDDSVVTEIYPVGWHTHYSDYGVAKIEHHGANRGSFTWDAPIKDLEQDFHLLKHRTYTVDKQGTYDELNFTKEMIGDILDVKIHGRMCWTFGLTAEAIALLGLENFMFAMYDYPDKLHELMAFLQKDMQNLIDFFDKEDLFTLMDDSEYIGSGGHGFTDLLPQNDFSGKVRTLDLWGFAESQETVGVSTEMFGEFIFPYQKTLLENFGLNCYGCCEPIEKRWEYIKQIKNLRRLSVSPWSDNALAADVLGNKYIYSKKPNPSLVCVGFEEDAIRKDIRGIIDVAKNCNLEIILKDTHTVEHQPDRFNKWVKIVREEINR